MGTFSDLVANSWLDAVARNDSYAVAQIWVKLHIGDPGSAGTNNPAAETTREQANFSVAASSRSISNSSAVNWTSVSTTETYTWVSLWDASTGGNFLGSEELPTPASMTAGDDFRIPTGDLDLAIV